jgi:UDP-2,3-diacylglucosamine hydrolase
MGDIFDLLFGYNDYILRFSHDAVERLRRLSKHTHIVYFEGNHDFCLEPLFPDIDIFSYKHQPQYFDYGGKRVGLAHGDRFDTGAGYKLYTWWLRNPLTLKLLRPWEKSIIEHRMHKLAQKSICREYVGFEKKVERILRRYDDADMVIEGHFHQAEKIGRYVSLPSLACQHAVGIAKEGEIIFKNINTWLT